MEVDKKQIFLTNLQLLGFDTAAAMEKYRIPFNKEMFNLPNKAGAEAVLYFLFDRLNPDMCRQQFRDCWPVIDKKSEAAFRKICCIWLQNIQKEESDAKLPRINASLFLSPGGDKFCQLLFAFSTYVVLHVIQKEHGIHESGLLGYPTLTTQNKELGFVMETTINCAAARHRKRYFQTVGQTLAAKEQWQDYADEITKTLRSFVKDVRDLEREKRHLVQQAAQKGVARGSPIPASRMTHDFDMSVHAAKRTQRVQQVRALWKSVEGFMEKSKEDIEIVASIVDRTQEKYSIDASDIKISIPHLMLRECEQEIRRRQVDNIYEGGQLNLVSVLQLWNLALNMYIQRLKQEGIKDLSTEANNMRAQVHTHQAYLANASALREKMAQEIPRRKEAVTKLRSQFTSEISPSALAMSAPSPPVNFELPRGHSGAVTPIGPVLPLTPDLVETPEAASDIANTVAKLSRKGVVEPFQPRAFGVTSAQNRNSNNSNSVRLPQPMEKDFGLSGIKTSSKQSASVSSKWRGGIQPRVVRHVGGRQPASSSTAGHKKPPHSVTKKSVLSGRPLASTPEKASRSGQVNMDRTPVPSQSYTSVEDAVQTPRDHAHDILSEKVVWAVMHGEEEDSNVPYHRELELPLAGVSQYSLHSTVPSIPSALDTPQKLEPLTDKSPSSASAIPQRQEPLVHKIPSSASATPSQRHRNAAQRTALQLDEDSPRSIQSHKANRHTEHESQKSPFPVKSDLLLSDSEQDQTVFTINNSPVTLVQQTGHLDTEHYGNNVPSLSPDCVSEVRREQRTEGDGGELEAKNVNVQNPPVAALSEKTFENHDLIHRSPMAMYIRRMWQDAISDDADSQEKQPAGDTAADWLNSDRSARSAETLAPPGQQSSTRPQLTVSHQPLHSSLHGSPAAPETLSFKSGPQGVSDGDLGHKQSSQAENKLDPNPHKTMINNTLAFFTSFDEDDGRGDSTLPWEEHLSALYDDHEDIEKDSEEGNGAQKAENTEHDSALDILFQRRTPASSRTPAVNSDSPLITFTPRHPLQSCLDQGEVISLSLASPFDNNSETHAEGTYKEEIPGHTVTPCSFKDSQYPFSISLGKETSPSEDASDKENIYSNSQHLKGSATLSNRLGKDVYSGSPKLSSSNAAASSPNKSQRTTDAGVAGILQDELLWEDEYDDSSPFNESFTPLQSGFCVQGKSQGAGVSQLQSSDRLQSTSSVGSTSAFPGQKSAGSLDEIMAAQLSRLKKIQAEAFKGLETGVAGSKVGKMAGKGMTSDGATPLQTALQRLTDGGEQQHRQGSESEPWDIFGEDDSILLPASP